MSNKSFHSTHQNFKSSDLSGWTPPGSLIKANVAESLTVTIAMRRLLGGVSLNVLLRPGHAQSHLPAVHRTLRDPHGLLLDSLCCISGRERKVPL